MQKHHIVALLTRGAWACVVAGLAQLSPATAASFPCEKAKSAVEKTICGDPELSALDEHLGRYYAAARVSLAHAEACLADDQRSWLHTVRRLCKDAACLKRAYLQRLAVLDALQPGATHLRQVELPQEMPLVWVVPPALDEVAAPRSLNTRALVVRGKLADEIASGGDGYVIQGPNGKKHLVVSLMFLEAPTEAALAGLARTPNATYEVRGRSEATMDAAPHFAPSRCTFVYRASP